MSELLANMAQSGSTDDKKKTPSHTEL